MNCNIKATFAILGYLLSCANSNVLEAAVDTATRTFANHTDQSWTIQVCPRPKGKTKDGKTIDQQPETGVMIFRESDGTIIAKLGEGCLVDKVELPPMTKYSVEFTISGKLKRFYHCFALMTSDDIAKNGAKLEKYVFIDFGTFNQLSSTTAVAPLLFDPFQFRSYKLRFGIHLLEWDVEFNSNSDEVISILTKKTPL